MAGQGKTALHNFLRIASFAVVVLLVGWFAKGWLSPVKAVRGIPSIRGGEKEIAVNLGDGVKLEMVLIPAGEFLMGHRVRITKPFYLGKYEVTQEQWQAVMGNNPSYFKGPKNPVEQVSWDDCQQLLKRLNEQVGGKFSLPTEAQWEYACRAGSMARYCFGDDEEQLDEYAWYKGNAKMKTHPVGKKKSNAWGLYDVHGNVFEWCQDWVDGGYYANSPTDDPTGPTTGSGRVASGGCWAADAVFCGFAYHGGGPSPGTRTPALGLRVSLVLAESQVEAARKQLRLRRLAPQTVEVGKPLTVAMSVENPDAWKGKLRYSLGPQCPAGTTVNAETGEFAWTPPPDQAAGLYDVIVSAQGPDGQTAQTTFVVTVKAKAGREEAKFGKQIRVFEVQIRSVLSVAFSPDGRRVLTGLSDHTAVLWDTDTGAQIRVFKGHHGVVTSVAFSPDGKRVLTGSDDYTAILWNVGTGQQLHVFTAQYLTSVAFSPDGKRVLTGSVNGTAILWDADTGLQRHVFMGNSAVFSVAFSPDGKRVLTGLGDHTAVLWDADTGAQIRTFQGT